MPQLKYIPLEQVWWDKRFRDDLGDIAALAESIKEKGILQPITVAVPNERGYELLAGERRVTAARSAGLTEIPALIREKRDVIDAREVELLENIARKNFTWAEECALVAELDSLCRSRNMEWSGRKTAELLGESKSNVARKLEMAQALEQVPELAQVDTFNDAHKMLKALEEKAIVQTLRQRQTAAMEAPGLKRGLDMMLKIADGNYVVGDTFKGLAELRSEGAVHIIECDPPYGINLNEQKRSKDNVVSNVHSYNEVESSEYVTFLNKLSKELYRVAGQNCWLVFWFGPTWQREVLDALRSAGWQVDEIPAVWTKHSGQTMQPERYFARGYESFFLARKGNPVLLKRGRLNVFDYPPVPGTKKYHPTERPVLLIEEILNCLGVPRQIVLVPFLGSGATLRAAYNCGMSAFGWDLNPEYKDKFMLAVEEDTKALSGDSDDNDETSAGNQ